MERQRRSPKGEKEELHGKTITFAIYEENGWIEEPTNLELVENRKFEEENQGIILCHIPYNCYYPLHTACKTLGHPWKESY